MGKGKIRAISISKTRKITARRKNRSEKGIRAELFGSNPHSKGEDFSRSTVLRDASAHASVKTRGGRAIPIMENVRARDIVEALVGGPHFQSCNLRLCINYKA